MTHCRADKLLFLNYHKNNRYCKVFAIFKKNIASNSAARYTYVVVPTRNKGANHYFHQRIFDKVSEARPFWSSRR